MLKITLKNETSFKKENHLVKKIKVNELISRTHMEID